MMGRWSLWHVVVLMVSNTWAPTAGYCRGSWSWFRTANSSTKTGLRRFCITGIDEIRPHQCLGRGGMGGSGVWGIVLWWWQWMFMMCRCHLMMPSQRKVIFFQTASSYLAQDWTLWTKRYCVETIQKLCCLTLGRLGVLQVHDRYVHTWSSLTGCPHFFQTRQK